MNRFNIGDLVYFCSLDLEKSIILHMKIRSIKENCYGGVSYSNSDHLEGYFIKEKDLFKTPDEALDNLTRRIDECKKELSSENKNQATGSEFDKFTVLLNTEIKNKC